MAAKIPAEQLVAWIKDPTLKPNEDYLVVDVRGEDSVGGNIVGAVNIPSDDFIKDPAQFSQQLSGAKRLVFHCALSQVRGPKTANVYVNELLGKQTTSDQEIYVLEGGFTNWQSKFGQDETLTEKYDAELWKA
ncbi:Rhodanese-like domain-containing protein [Chytriomyces sp. MP71]|nr:Rhodanese-like domain-containing protein [Chytriomyces sp. MP71]